MGFLDAIEKEFEKENKSKGGNFERKEIDFPKAKHNQIFLSKKKEPEVLVQILPDAEKQGNFFQPLREIGINYIKRDGTEKFMNFTLDGKYNPDSFLDPKIKELQDKELLTNKMFGGQQQARKGYQINVVRVSREGNSFVQEKDQNGDIVVRSMRLRHSAFEKLKEQLKDPMQNVNGSDLSFMNPDSASPVRISMPPEGAKEYGVTPYTQFKLPPLPQGWESQLEDLQELAKPTEQISLDLVKAITDMIEGKDPTPSGQSSQEPEKVEANPYAEEVNKSEPENIEPPVQEVEDNTPPTPPASEEVTPPNKSEADSDADIMAELERELGL